MVQLTPLRCRRYVLISFHGDTGGLVTIPMMAAILAVMATPEYASRRVAISLCALGRRVQCTAWAAELRPCVALYSTLLGGFDANSYDKGKAGKLLALSDWLAMCEENGVQTCWGSPFDKAASGCT